MGEIKHKSTSQWETNANILFPGLWDDQGQGSLINLSCFNKVSEWRSHGVPVNKARLAGSLLS